MGQQYEQPAVPELSSKYLFVFPLHMSHVFYQSMTTETPSGCNASFQPPLSLVSSVCHS